MTTSNEAIAAAREIVKLLYAHENDAASESKVAATIQKHYAAKDAEIEKLKVEIEVLKQKLVYARSSLD